jgi:hypothetical protein
VTACFPSRGTGSTAGRISAQGESALGWRPTWSHSPIVLGAWHDDGVRPVELYDLQLELECKRVLPSGRLGRIPCANPDDLALISIVRFLDGSGEFVRLRDDASAAVEVAVESLAVDDLFAGSGMPDVRGRRFSRRFCGRTGVFVMRPDLGEFDMVGARRRGLGRNG